MVEQWARYVGFVVLVAVLAWMGRYQVSGISNAGSAGSVILDRWTGKVDVCFFEKDKSVCQQVRPPLPMSPQITF